MLQYSAQLGLHPLWGLLKSVTSLSWKSGGLFANDRRPYKARRRSPEPVWECRCFVEDPQVQVLLKELGIPWSCAFPRARRHWQRLFFRDCWAKVPTTRDAAPFLIGGMKIPPSLRQRIQPNAIPAQPLDAERHQNTSIIATKSPSNLKRSKRLSLNLMYSHFRIWTGPLSLRRTPRLIRFAWPFCSSRMRANQQTGWPLVTGLVTWWMSNDGTRIPYANVL